MLPYRNYEYKACCIVNQSSSFSARGRLFIIDFAYHIILVFLAMGYLVGAHIVID